MAGSGVQEATSTGPWVSVLQLVTTPVPEVPGVQLATNCEVRLDNTPMPLQQVRCQLDTSNNYAGGTSYYLNDNFVHEIRGTLRYRLQ